MLYMAFPNVASGDVTRRDPIMSHAKDSIAFAPPKFMFGHRGPYLFDKRYGYIRHRLTASIVVDRSDGVHNVGRYDRLEKLLQKECSQPFQNDHYIVYSCRPL